MLSMLLMCLFLIQLRLVSCIKIDNLPPYITYYEPIKLTKVISYSNFQNLKEIEFFAFQTKFKLLTNQGTNIINQYSRIITQQHRESISLNAKKLLNHIIEGRIKDDPSSYVHGTFKHSTLDVVIHSSNATYFVEPIKKYSNKSYIYHSIIYRESDLSLDNWFSNENNFTYVHGPLQNLSFPLTRWQAKKITHNYPIDFVPPRLPEDVFFEPPAIDPGPHRRYSVCLLNIVVDHTFYQNVGRRNFRKTVEEVTYLVDEANRIFEQVDFDGDGLGKDVSLQIKTMMIHKSTSDPNYNLFNEKLSAEQLLQKLSEYDFDGDCLGVAFTFRSFPKRVLGLAFIADSRPEGTLGGICQERRYLAFRKKSVSYNAAFITVANNGIQLPRLMSVISLTHELGHSFGSYHDPRTDKKCSPKDRGGMYIMSENALTGHKSNNYKFSPCSLKTIKKTLELKSNCFTNRRPICGNGIPEAFEECDCGHPLQCYETDPCCTPIGGIGKDAECTYRRQEGSKCSPKRDQCCTSDCKIVSAEARRSCIGISACKLDSYCDGFHGYCPESPSKADGVSCLDRTGMCIDGECIKPCKVKEGLFDCECKAPEYSCTACCYGKNSTECLPAIKFGIITASGLPILKPDGESCDNGRGICNLLGDCVEEYKYMKDTAGDRRDDDKNGGDDDDFEKQTRSILEALKTLLIVLLVLLCIGLMICLVICFTPFAKLLTQSVNNPDYMTVILHQGQKVDPSCPSKKVDNICDSNNQNKNKCCSKCCPQRKPKVIC